MSLRLLLGILTPGLSDYMNQSALEGTDTSGKDLGEEDVQKIDFQTPAKFHIGMLSISLIAGLAFGGYVGYMSWVEKNTYLGYVRNLVIALVCRTFFSIIFDGTILLGTLLNVGGGNTLLAFEQISLNLVLALWLTLTIYLHARVQRNFNSEPTLRLYQYGIPGVAVYFAFVWIFTLQSLVPSAVWWIILTPVSQWIVNSINLLFLLIQLGLVYDIVRMMMKISLDNDSISLARYVAIMMGVLILIFWLQFGFTIGRFPLHNSTSYLYFYYFIDGLECAFVCLALYFFNKWVHILLNKISSLMTGIEEKSNVKPKEVLLNGSGDQRIVMIDSVFKTTESGKWKNSGEEGTRDIVYSNIVEPHRLKKTFDLYKRLNIIPTRQVTVVEGEEFYDCQFQSSLESNDFDENKLLPNQFVRSISSTSKPKSLGEGIKLKIEKTCEQTQKKNAFYSSKYLILDSKENEFPKYLETRPSVSSISGKSSLKDERVSKDFSSDLDSLMPDELVRKWLIDNSENMQKYKNQRVTSRQVSKTDSLNLSNQEILEFETPKQKPETKPVCGPCQKERRVSVSETIISTISSAVSSALFGPSKSERKNLDKENSLTTDPVKLNITDRSDSEKSFVSVKEKLETAEPPKKRRPKNTDVKDESKISKAISSDVNAGVDFLFLQNKNFKVAQVDNLKTLDSVPDKTLNTPKLKSKTAAPEISEKKFSTEPCTI